MLQLTDNATLHLKSALSGLHPEEDLCFRLGVTQEGVRITVDQERPGDATIKHDDEVLVVMDAMSVSLFEGHTMDFDEATKQLTFS